MDAMPRHVRLAYAAISLWLGAAAVRNAVAPSLDIGPLFHRYAHDVVLVLVAALPREELRERDALTVDLRERVNERCESEAQSTSVIGDAERDHDGARARHAHCSCLASSSDTSWAIACQ